MLAAFDSFHIIIVAAASTPIFHLFVPCSAHITRRSIQNIFNARRRSSTFWGCENFNLCAKYEGNRRGGGRSVRRNLGYFKLAHHSCPLKIFSRWYVMYLRIPSGIFSIKLLSMFISRSSSSDNSALKRIFPSSANEINPISNSASWMGAEKEGVVNVGLFRRIRLRPRFDMACNKQLFCL